MGGSLTSSPYVAPTDSYLFQSLEHFMSGRIFRNKEIEKNKLFQTFSGNKPNFFKHGIKDFPSQCTAVIENEGDYIFDK